MVSLYSMRFINQQTKLRKASPCTRIRLVFHDSIRWAQIHHEQSCCMRHIFGIRFGDDLWIAEVSKYVKDDKWRAWLLFDKFLQCCSFVWNLSSLHPRWRYNTHWLEHMSSKKPPPQSAPMDRLPLGSPSKKRSGSELLGNLAVNTVGWASPWWVVGWLQCFHPISTSQRDETGRTYWLYGSKSQIFDAICMRLQNNVLLSPWPPKYVCIWPSIR